jgi:hypothetical protein
MTNRQLFLAKESTVLLWTIHPISNFHKNLLYCGMRPLFFFHWIFPYVLFDLMYDRKSTTIIITVYYNNQINIIYYLAVTNTCTKEQCLDFWPLKIVPLIYILHRNYCQFDLQILYMTWPTTTILHLCNACFQHCLHIICFEKF